MTLRTAPQPAVDLEVLAQQIAQTLTKAPAHPTLDIECAEDSCREKLDLYFTQRSAFESQMAKVEDDLLMAFIA